MKAYDTLTDALEGLRQQGFTKDYNLKPDCLYCQSDSIELQPADFDIVEVYRFEGMTDPGDETVLYAIEAQNGDKGTLVDAYGTYSEAISPEMAEKLRYTPEN
ncbi:phosphoribosylpyrophosphate synthetase [Spirosoma aerolatum]|uniref:phosphoribosylpyrophosphate synthetase n=1 Tax=Spirosoma aerolatum TaxID=1211326 RepID=UPI0009AC400F|nr:phosphoribosylpyrophosphate synthetase [Spirosoma aerolatum]